MILDHFGRKGLQKVVKGAKLAVPNDFRPHQWEKIGKVAKCVKLAVPNDFRPLGSEKIGKSCKMCQIGCYE